MSALSYTSSDADVNAAYDDNASYMEDLSIAKCRAFITAVRILIRRLNNKEADQGSSLEKNIADLRAELNSASEWLAKNGNANVESGRTDFTRGRAL